MKISFKLGAVLLSMSAVAASHAVTIDFESPNLFDPLTNQYAGVGVTSDGASEIEGGLGNGDPGNWGVEGTNGSKFLGNNGANNYTTTFDFAVGQTSLSLDITRTNGSDANDTYTATAYDGGHNILAQATFGLGNVNNWNTLSYNGPALTELTIQTSGIDFHPYGIDNLNFGNAVPEPASMAALGMGALALIRRRRAK